MTETRGRRALMTSDGRSPSTRLTMAAETVAAGSGPLNPDRVPPVLRLHLYLSPLLDLYLLERPLALVVAAHEAPPAPAGATAELLAAVTIPWPGPACRRGPLVMTRI